MTMYISTACWFLDFTSHADQTAQTFAGSTEQRCLVACCCTWSARNALPSDADLPTTYHKVKQPVMKERLLQAYCYLIYQI